MNKLEGKVAVVTGGSRGIGEGIVRRLAAEGATVYGTYNSGSDRAEAIAAEMVANGMNVRFIKTDVTSEQSVKELVDAVVKESGRLDILVNNAGITKDTLVMRMSEKDWDDVLTANLKGTFLCSKAVCRQMMSQRAGRIINITSVVGITGNAGQANYSASKAGIIGLSKSLAKEFASRNILVNCIAPGYVETDMTHKLTEEQRAGFLGVIPLKRAGSIDEIASAVTFFASSDSSYITGQVLCVDGGMVM
jgi:3-oxoacyl-[acyl-carrier protein] reductase